MKRIRIAVASSTGGHLVEARRLACVYEKHEHFFFTFSGGVADELSRSCDVVAIPNIHRSRPYSWIRGMLMSFLVVMKRRPDVVLTTGAGIVIFFCIFSKLAGAKLIFIESMASVDRPTLTARVLYPFSDLFIVQWPGLLSYFPKARYLGRLF